MEKSTFLLAVQILLLTGGLSISIYQSVVILEAFIVQPSLTTSTPLDENELMRPDVIFCKNVVKSFLSHAAVSRERGQKRYSHYDSIDLANIAVVSGQYLPYLNNTPTSNNPSEPSTRTRIRKDNLNNIEDDFALIGKMYRNCSAVLDTCLVLHNGRVQHNWLCCEVHHTIATKNNICHRVKVPLNLKTRSAYQADRGYPNAVMYQIQYLEPNLPYIYYDAYLVQRDDHTDIKETEYEKINKNQEVLLALKVRRTERLSMDNDCSKIPELVDPTCRRLVMAELTEKLCGCDPENPFWLGDNVTGDQWSTKKNANKSKYRACRLFEEELCHGQKEVELRQQYDVLKRRCYKRPCISQGFTIIRKDSHIPFYLEPFTETNNGGIRHNASVLYVYYESITITLEKEVQILSVLTVISALGGVWGIWLGWSVYDAIMGLIKLAIEAQPGSKKGTSKTGTKNMANTNIPENG